MRELVADVAYLRKLARLHGRRRVTRIYAGPDVARSDRRFGKLILEAWRVADARDAAEARLRHLAEQTSKLR